MCDFCPVAKMHKLSFVLSTIKLNRFELIYLDVWGKFSTTSLESTTIHDGYNCFLTMVDDFSGYT